jgi:hypothetical protein
VNNEKEFNRKILRSYTEGTFIFGDVNKALREFNWDVIFSYKYYIMSLHFAGQEDVHIPDKLYRGCMMSRD